MEKTEFKMVGVYADYKKRNAKVIPHPSYLVEDDENYYIIHLTSNHNGNVATINEEIKLINRFSHDVQTSQICKYIAVVSKRSQYKAIVEKPNKCLLTSSICPVDENDELKEIIKRSLKNGDFRFYDGDFKCLAENERTFNSNAITHFLLEALA